MSATPAAELARVRRRFPQWSIRPVQSGTGYTAQRGTRRIWSSSLPDLERDLAKRRRRRPAG